MEKNVLWTGGWDSTFRVLDLVINKKEKVQPFYVLDERRASTKMEISTMDKIKSLINEINPDFSNKILETITINRNSIPENNGITNAYIKLKEKSHLGDQYDWLARYAESVGINNLELCVHIDDTVEGFIKNNVKLIEENNDRYYKLVENTSQKELKIFSYYNFPLFDMTKLDMEEQARKSGFDHIMEITWFCHSPYKGKPCGMCNPCKYTREEGLGRRVSTPTLTMKLNRKINAKFSRFKRKFNIS